MSGWRRVRLIGRKGFCRSSFPRTRESMLRGSNSKWIPAFAGMTALGASFRVTNSSSRKDRPLSSVSRPGVVVVPFSS